MAGSDSVRCMTRSSKTLPMLVQLTKGDGRYSRAPKKEAEVLRELAVPLEKVGCAQCPLNLLIGAFLEL